MLCVPKPSDRLRKAKILNFPTGFITAALSLWLIERLWSISRRMFIWGFVHFLPSLAAELKRISASKHFPVINKSGSNYTMQLHDHVSAMSHPRIPRRHLSHAWWMAFEKFRVSIIRGKLLELRSSRIERRFRVQHGHLLEYLWRIPSSCSPHMMTVLLMTLTLLHKPEVPKRTLFALYMLQAASISCAKPWWPTDPMPRQCGTGPEWASELMHCSKWLVRIFTSRCILHCNFVERRFSSTPLRICEIPCPLQTVSFTVSSSTTGSWSSCKSLTDGRACGGRLRSSRSSLHDSHLH